MSLNRPAVAVLGMATVHAAFEYLGAPDIVGHTVGTGPEYRAAIESADRRGTERA
jgi:hypothetical protein